MLSFGKPSVNDLTNPQCNNSLSHIREIGNGYNGVHYKCEKI